MAALGLCCGAWASHCGGFSCYGARALGTRASEGIVYMVYFLNKIKLFKKALLCLSVSVFWKKLSMNTNKFILETYWGFTQSRHQPSNFSCRTSFNPHNIPEKCHWIPQSPSIMLMLAFCLNCSSFSNPFFFYPSSISLSLCLWISCIRRQLEDNSV